jgi:cytochrome P450
MNIFRRLAGRLRPRHVAPAGELHFDDQAVARDPMPHYERLRGGGAVQFLPRHDAWFVLSHDGLRFAFAHPELLSNSPYEPIDAVLLGADPPAHTAARQAVMPLFGAEVLDRVAASSEARAAKLLRGELDAVRDFAVPLSELAAAQLLGLDDDALAAIRDAQQQSQDIVQLSAALDRIAERASVFARLHEGGMNDAQTRSLIRLLWLASTVTTERVIAHGIHLLAAPELRAAVRNDGSLLAPFVDEVLRLHPPELVVRRRATEAVTIDGTTIPAGALVHLSIVAANRDPAVFAEPSTLRLDRPAARHLAFGFGIHHCVGAGLARRVITASLRALLAHAPAFALADAPEVGWCSMTAHPIARLPIRTAP